MLPTILPQLIYFIIISLICFTIPGYFLLKRLSLPQNPWEKLVLSTVLGLVIFTLGSYILMILKLTILILPLVLLVNFLNLPSSIKLLKNLKTPISIPLVLVFLVGVIGQLLVIAPSGILNNGDLIFYSAHGHDGTWHIALMNEIVKGYPLKNPSFAGFQVYNYHFFSDIAPAFFNSIFKFDTLDLYFRFFPLLYSLLLGGSAFILGKAVSKKFSGGIWATIFTYYAGSFGFVVTWLQNRSIGGESVFWASQIQSSIGNPPQIISLIIVLVILVFISSIDLKTKLFLDLKSLILVLLISSLIGFKVYASIPILLLLGIIGLYQLIRYQSLYLLTVAIISGIFSLLIYIPNSTASTGFLIFEPWWYIRTMIVEPSRLNLLDWELRRQTYIAEGNYKRVFLLEGIGFLIFFFGNLGLRFLGLWYFIKKDFSPFYLSALSISIISLALPLLFLQKGVASNSIQFLQYLLLMTGILAGIMVAKFTDNLKSSTVRYTLYTVILVLMVPTQIGLLYNFYKNPPTSKVTSAELLALKALNGISPKESIILIPNYNKYLRIEGGTPPIEAWFDTSYISAFSNREVYFADFEQVDIMGYQFKERQQIIDQIFKEKDPNKFSRLVKSTGARYLYFPKIQSPQVDLSKTPFKQVYQNKEAEIWQIII